MSRPISCFTPGSVLTVIGTLTEPSYVIMTYTTRTGVFGDVSNVLGQGYHVNYDDGAGEVRLETHDAPTVDNRSGRR
jgi:hypothetical protein